MFKMLSCLLVIFIYHLQSVLIYLPYLRLFYFQILQCSYLLLLNFSCILLCNVFYSKAFLSPSSVTAHFKNNERKNRKTCVSGIFHRILIQNLTALHQIIQFPCESSHFSSSRLSLQRPGNECTESEKLLSSKVAGKGNRIHGEKEQKKKCVYSTRRYFYMFYFTIVGKENLLLTFLLSI